MELLVTICHISLPIYNLLLLLPTVIYIFSAVIIHPIINAITFGSFYANQPTCLPCADTYTTLKYINCSDMVYWFMNILEEPQCHLDQRPSYYPFCIEGDNVWYTLRQLMEVVVIDIIIIISLINLTRVIILGVMKPNAPGS